MNGDDKRVCLYNIVMCVCVCVYRNENIISEKSKTKREQFQAQTTDGGRRVYCRRACGSNKRKVKTFS